MSIEHQFYNCRICIAPGQYQYTACPSKLINKERSLPMAWHNRMCCTVAALSLLHDTLPCVLQQYYPVLLQCNDGVTVLLHAVCALTVLLWHGTIVILYYSMTQILLLHCMTHMLLWHVAMLLSYCMAKKCTIAWQMCHSWMALMIMYSVYCSKTQILY